MPRSPQKAADSGYSALVLDRSRWLTRANGMTLIRLIAAPVLAVAISADASLAATAVFTLAVATDVADGIVARRFGEASAKNWNPLAIRFGQSCGKLRPVRNT